MQYNYRIPKQYNYRREKSERTYIPTIQKQYNYRRDNYQKSQAFPTRRTILAGARVKVLARGDKRKAGSKFDAATYLLNLEMMIDGEYLA